MIEKQFYGEHKKPQLTAYERRKINSQKIAQVQFEYKNPEGYPKSSSWNDKEEIKKEREWIKRKRQEMLDEEKHIKKNVKPVWTPIDQKNEEELWDE